MFALSISVLIVLHVLIFVLNSGSAGQPKRNFTLFKYFENKIIFKLHKIIHFIKWYFCHYPRVRDMIEKSYQSIVFKPQNVTPIKTKVWSKILHQDCQLLIWPSLVPRRPFERETFGRNDCIVINTVKSGKHAFWGTLH